MPAKYIDPASGQVLDIKHARINATADGVNVVIAAVAATQLLILGYAFSVTVAGTVSLQDSQGTPVVHATFPLAVNGGISYPGGDDSPAFEIAAGFGFNINNPAGVDTLGHVTYVSRPT